MNYYCDKCKEYFTGPYYCQHWYHPEAPVFRRIEMKTVEELRKYFNTEFGIGEWPKQFEVSAELYGRCCQVIFDRAQKSNIQKIFRKGLGDLGLIEVVIGEHGGIMFKNVELILMEDMHPNSPNPLLGE